MNAASSDTVELSIAMPCLNEAQTLAVCIRKGRRFLETSGVIGEIADDESRAIATAEGATRGRIESRGYGAALLGGIAAARGRFVIMGDADDSMILPGMHAFMENCAAAPIWLSATDFEAILQLERCPLLHRVPCNPVLSFLGRLFFRIDIGDFHCGLRGFVRDRILAID